MNQDDRLAALERKVQYLTDRQEILDCITRTARGNDRFDEALIVGGYHEGAVHELARKRISGAEYGAHANHAHAALCAQNLHHVTNHNCEIDGDVAHAETYVIGLFLAPDGATSRMISGRYVDRLEKRDGRWGIVVRRTTAEVVLEGEAALMGAQAFRDAGYLKGSRDKSDLSYQRPLTLDGGERWE